MDIQEILEKLESKHKDCIEFKKKYESRKMNDLEQYYDGASWALKYAISLMKKE